MAQLAVTSGRANSVGHAEVLPLFQRGDPAAEPSREGGLGIEELYGRLVELSGAPGASAVLTAAMRLVVEAQRRGEPVAWVTAQESSFFPPDAAEGGVDLDALVVVRVPEAAEVPRAADPLARSGAFGLLVLDLGAKARVPMPLLTRLSGLVRKHEMALAFLTEKGSELPSVGSLISLRAEAGFRRSVSRLPPPVSRSEAPVEAGGAVDETDFLLELHVLKDKRRAPGARVVEPCRAPPGL